MSFMIGFTKTAKKEKEDEIEMSKKDFKKEHKRLIKVLKSPSHEDDLEEAEEQEKEMKQELKKSAGLLSAGASLIGRGLVKGIKGVTRLGGGVLPTAATALGAVGEASDRSAKFKNQYRGLVD